ncbi:lipid-A-disaccharide synthase [Verrucomicrobiota bacterium sgz303538]
MKLYLIAGEASGDARGAELMRALKASHPDLEFHGAGGREMRSLAGEHFADWTDEAVVGLWDVLKKYGYFRAQFNRMLAELQEVSPTALILIDYPGFNLRFAEAVRRRFPSLKIIYYISPQVWAWNRRRIPKMARMLDLMLCIFPFEQPLYTQSGLKTVFVGHPMLDSLAAKRIETTRDGDLVALLPGSRTREVRKIFPVMLEAAQQIRTTRKDVRFETSAASPALAEQMRALLRDAGMNEEFCRITLRNSHELMQRAGAGMVASGTATLEAAYFGLPLVILYRVAWLTWVVGKRLVRVPFLGMPNILAGREIAREFLQDAAHPEAIAKEVLRLLDEPGARERIQHELAGVIAQLGASGAGTRAAEAVAQELGLETR